MPYRIIERAPTLAEYRRICVAVGWQDFINFDAAPARRPRTAS